MKINKTGITFTALKEMKMNIIIDTVYEADQEKMHEFVTPLSPNFSNKCIIIKMYKFSLLPTKPQLIKPCKLEKN